MTYYSVAISYLPKGNYLYETNTSSMKLLLNIIVCGAVLSSSFAVAQEKDKWDVNNPPGPYKEHSFTVNEGTWLNLDVSPDGQKIVFDILGDIYVMPITGGTAQPLRQGMAMEVQPRYSYDGKKILFTCDAGGGDNIWVMNADGTNAKPITKEKFRLLNNATWSPDGKYIIARKHFTSTRSLGAGELWMYHITGGSGLQLTSKKNDQQDLNEPCSSPDGRYIYYSEDMYPGGNFQYNKDPNQQIFVINQYDRKLGTIERVTGGPGGAVRPQISHDGKTLAFVRRVRTKSVLYLRNLATGEEWPIYENLSKDQQEAWTIFGIYTGFAWTPNDQHIVIWSQGKIMKVNVKGFNAAQEIPFTCNIKTRITDAVRFQQSIDEPTFNAKVLRNAITAPNEQSVVFSAVGQLWQKQLPNGEIKALTGPDMMCFEPSFSADGKQLIFVSWSDSATGSIKVMNLNSHKISTITNAKGIYRTPRFSNDGKNIVYSKEGSSDVLGFSYTVKPGIYYMPATGRAEHFVTEDGEYPSFSADNDRIYYQIGGNTMGSLDKSFNHCNLQGLDNKVVFKSTYGNQFTVSPDNEWVAFVHLHQVYIAPFPHTGKAINLSQDNTDFPTKIVSKDAGINLHWSADSKKLHYTLGNQYFTINTEDRFEFVAGKPDSNFKVPEKGITLELKLTTDKPKGAIAFTHSRILTMQSNNEVIEDGTIVVEGNIIKKIGKFEQVAIPAGAQVIDCKGKTITPGFIDAHAHGNHFRQGITPEKHWPYYANLAYGVTTMHDPSANSEMVFALSELVKSGKMVGPRVFSTGTILYGADGDFKAVVNSLDDAKSALRRTNAFGAFSVKSYNQPRREQRQMVIEAARSLNMEVVPEGGSFFYHNLSMILDGHTTIEHNIPIATVYNDVVQLWSRSKTANTPTLIVGYGALSGENYWYQHTNVWEKERLLRFTPRVIVDTRSRHRVMAPEEEYEQGYMQVSRSLKKLNDAGVLINMGAHGQIQGIGAHWEIWMLAQGGMTPYEALKAATINPATSLGLDNQIGSLQEGKLADLLIMDKNPLESIYNTEFISYTMVNGRLYDAATMNEVGNYNRKRPKFYWERSKNYASFPWYSEQQEFGD